MPKRNDGSHIVFVVGCPRSGTTWLQRLLAAHPQIHSGPETGLFDHQLGYSIRNFERTNTVADAREVGLRCYFTREEFYTMTEGYLDTLLARLTEGVPCEDWWLEKTPNHAMWLPEIHAMLPQAKVIHMLRDGRDAVASMLAAGAGWGHYWAPRTVKKAAHIWVDHVKASRAGAKLLPQGQWMEVRYETLLQEPQAALQQCAAFLDLEWEDTTLQEAVRQNTASYDSQKKHSVIVGGQGETASGTPLVVKGEIARTKGRESHTLHEPEGFIRRAQAGSWKQDLTPLGQWRVHKYAGDMLRECGYL